MASTNTFLLNHLCRGGSASTTGTRNKLRGNGILLPCKKHLTMLVTIFFKNDFTRPHYVGCAILSTWTPSTLTSVSNLSTFMTQGEACKTKSLKENRDGSYKVFFHVPYFGVRQSAGRSILRCCLYNIYAKKKGISKELILTLRSIMISQEVDLVAVISMEQLGDVAAHTILLLLMKPLLTLLWGPRSIPNNWADVCGFLKPPGSQRFWKVNKHGAFSIPRKALGLRPNDQSCHHETWLHLHFVDWNNKWSNQAYYNGNIRFKERLAVSSYGTQKRNISEVMSDHSLSSQTRNHLRIPGSCDFTCSSSRSDLMSSGVFARLPQVRRISVSPTLVFPMRHFPSRTPRASCPPLKWIFSNVQYILDSFVGSLLAFAAEAQISLQDQNYEPLWKGELKFTKDVDSH